MTCNTREVQSTYMLLHACMVAYPGDERGRRARARTSSAAVAGHLCCCAEKAGVCVVPPRACLCAATRPVSPPCSASVPAAWASTATPASPPGTVRISDLRCSLCVVLKCVETAVAIHLAIWFRSLTMLLVDAQICSTSQRPRAGSLTACRSACPISRTSLRRPFHVVRASSAVHARNRIMGVFTHAS